MELCLDVHDPGAADPERADRFAAMASFWARATGLRLDAGNGPDDPGDLGGLDGEPGADIALCPVPEPKTVKHRVHLDVRTADVDDLVAAGGTVLERLPGWTVLADPDGGELCAFVRDRADLPDYRVYEVVVDSTDPAMIARWWADRFGAKADTDENPWWWVEGVPGMPFDCLVFTPVPEPKTVKNRLHWDVRGDVEEFLAAGATRLWEMPRWTVLADPEGNEFCVFPAVG